MNLPTKNSVIIIRKRRKRIIFLEHKESTKKTEKKRNEKKIEKLKSVSKKSPFLRGSTPEDGTNAGIYSAVISLLSYDL